MVASGEIEESMPYVTPRACYNAGKNAMSTYAPIRLFFSQTIKFKDYCRCIIVGNGVMEGLDEYMVLGAEAQGEEGRWV